MSELIDRQEAIEACMKYNGQGYIWSLIMKEIEQLPSAEPEIIHCEKCQFSEYDALYGDRYCHYDGKAEVVPDGHFCGYGRERQNG